MEDKRFEMGTKLSPPHERHLVWDKLFTPHIQNAVKKAHPIWANIMKDCEQWFSQEIHVEGLANGNAWRFINVEGKVDEERFWILLSKSIFPINLQLRHLSEVDYCILRDTFHDTIGHLPPLEWSPYADTMRYIGALGVRAYRQGNVPAQRAISRLYWATIEFSGMKDGQYGELIKPLGAGIVSSKGELAHFFERTDKYCPLNFDDIVEWKYGVEGFQDRYYIIEEWEDVNVLLDQFVKSYL